jgi:hypothetical protein
VLEAALFSLMQQSHHHRTMISTSWLIVNGVGKMKKIKQVELFT